MNSINTTNKFIIRKSKVEIETFKSVWNKQSKGLPRKYPVNSFYLLQLFSLLFIFLFSITTNANQQEAERFAKGELRPYRAVDADAFPFEKNEDDISINIVPSTQLNTNFPTFQSLNSSTTFNLSMNWNQVAFADKYRLEERLAGESSWNTVYEGNLNSSILSRSEGEYEYRVIACLVNPETPSATLCESIADWSAIASVNLGDEDSCEACQEKLSSVASTYSYEPYYSGQRKSIYATRRDKAGNAVEMAGVYLSDVLEASDSEKPSSKFIFGRIRINVDDLTAWVGVDDVRNAAKIINVGGGDAALFSSVNGVPQYVEMNHVWTEIDGTYADPSFQIKSVPETKSLQADAGVDPSEVLNALINDGMFSNPDGILLPDVGKFDELLEATEKKTHDYVSDNPALTYSDYLTSSSLSLPDYSYGDQLPYEVLEVYNEYSVSTSANDSSIFDALPTLKKERLVVRVSGINETIDMPTALDSSIVVDYVAATTADQSTIDSNGGILNTEYKGVNLKPRLLLNGNQIAVGSAISVGSYQQITVEMLDADESSNTCTNSNKTGCRDIVNHNVTVGGVHAIALDGQYIDGAELENEIEELQDLADTHKDNMLDSRFSGPLLSYLGRSYHRQLDIEVQNARASTGSFIFHKVNEAIISINLTAREDSDGTYKMSVGSRAIDAPRNLFSVYPYQQTSSFNAAPILFSLGQVASALEHAVFTKAIGWPAESTMSIMRFAVSHEQPIYVITSENKDRILNQLSYTSDIINNMSQLIDSGRIIITPPGAQNIGGWSGYGFIALNPETGGASFLINGGAAGGEQPLGELNQEETNTTFIKDMRNILDSVTTSTSASIDGLLYGTYNETLYETSLEQNAASGSAFVSDFFLVGDIRNLGISSYEAAFNNGSLGDVGLAAVGFIPAYDMVKGSYKAADNVFDIKGLSNVFDALGTISLNSERYLGNLTRNADVLGGSATNLFGGSSAYIVNANRNGMDFTSVVVQNPNIYADSLGMQLSDLVTTGAKGEFVERAAQNWATSRQLSCYFCSADTNAKGFDNIFMDADGNFIISESKWISSNSNVGLGSLSNTNSGKQLSDKWMFGANLDGGPDSALSRTPSLTQSQRAELRAAFQNGKIKTQLVVLKPKHIGAGVTQRLTTDGTFGTIGSSKLNDIVIIEVSINP